MMLITILLSFVNCDDNVQHFISPSELQFKDLSDFIQKYPCDNINHLNLENINRVFEEYPFILFTFVSYTKACDLQQSSKITSYGFTCYYRNTTKPSCYTSYKSMSSSNYDANIILKQNIYGHPLLFYINKTEHIEIYTTSVNNKIHTTSVNTDVLIYNKTHTTSFNENWLKHENKDFTFYDSDTFGINIYSNSCVIIKNNNVFRNYVKKNIECTGKWCIEQEFKCGAGSKRNCYEVEHIIDIKNPMFDDNCKNIAANLVMSWGKWNAGLGGMYPNLNNIEQEKNIVYGSYRVNQVIDQIQFCNKECINKLDISMAYKQYNLNVFIGILHMFALVL